MSAKKPYKQPDLQDMIDEALDDVKVTRQQELLDLKEASPQHSHTRRMIFFPLFVLAFFSFYFFLSQRVETREDSLSIQAANATVFQDLKQTPKSLRARKVARALLEFSFELSHLSRLNSLEHDDLVQPLTTVKKILSETDEDQELLKRYRALRSEKSGAIYFY